MGLLDLFRKTNREPGDKAAREVARLERLVSNKLSQNLDRQEAIQQLGRLGTSEAATALLKRFNWYLDPSITDQEEKESAVVGIVNAGESALDPIRRYCRRAESLTWPLKALEQIVHEERLVEELLLLLDQFDIEYVRNPEPKVQLLNSLEAHPGQEVRLAIEPFLEDASEPVRFAAAVAIFAMNDPDAVGPVVAAVQHEESLRIRNRVAQELTTRGWEISSELSAACTAALPKGFRLEGGRVRLAT